MSRLFPVAVALIVAGTLPMAAQQQAISPVTVSKGAARVVSVNAVAAINGTALDSINGRLSHVLVRLRDARLGRIVDTQLTDKAGLFTFKAIEPGSYIVEIVGEDKSILAASQLLNLNGGDAASVIVKLPFRTKTVIGLIGGATSSVLLIAAQAVAGGIATVVPPKPVSPNQ
jgi:hypothetical protein